MTQIGTVIEGKYEILKQIGLGGMSIVYLAMDKRLNKQWAVKEIRKQDNDKNNEVVIQSMITEANLIKRLDHPALPRIVDIIDNGKTLYIVMDYIEGEPLDKVLTEYGAQPQDIVIEWAKQLCDVLDYLHTRTPPIIYRDMKPANIMLKPEGNIKLIDFGIAREYKEKNLADTVSLGTKGYAAPEQFGGKGQTDTRTDVYCLGVTLYHLVTGQNPCEPPYELYPIRQWNGSLSGGLEKIIQKCTQLNPDDRYQSCAELLYALQHYEEIDDIYRKKQKNKITAFVSTLALTFLFGITAMVLFLLAGKLKNDDYTHMVETGQYLEAINIDATKKDAFVELVKSYKSDSILTDDEANKLKQLENDKKIEQLKQNQNDYSEVCYAIGTAYWFYSETDNANKTEATKWFSNVVAVNDSNLNSERRRDKQIATVYKNIGDFYKNEITWNKEGGVTEHAYSNYWANLSKMLDNDNLKNEFVTLKILDEIVDKAYERKLKLNNDGITNEQMLKMIEKVKTVLNGITSANDEVIKRKDELLKLCDSKIKLLES